VATLDEVTTPAPDGTLTLHEGWRQGHGVYGGLTIAAAIRAIEAKVGDPRRLVRSVTAELPGPTLPGEAAFSVDILRSGSSVTVARAALAQSGEVTTHVVAVLAATRDAPSPPTWRDLTPPTAPAWSSIAAIPPEVPGRPEFTQYFEYRLVAGVPFGGSPASDDAPAEAIGWIRPCAPEARRDAAYLAAVIDAWWPAVFVRMTGPRPLATITFTLEIVGDASDAGDAPLLYRGTVPVAGDGYFLETRELWTEDGRLLALNHQTFAVIR
jgi:acyl-CoA thioesterase